MTAQGKSARAIVFARDVPDTAIALIPLDGELHAYSWDLGTGELIRTTDGRVRDPLITPDGQWVWWFDRTTNELWRRPFATSPRGRQERPLRLRPRPGTQVLVGGDGTAVVARAVPGSGVAVSLLPIGRLRPGADPVLIAQVPHIKFISRSRDDDLVAIHSDDVTVYRAHSGAFVATDAMRERQKIISFTADASLLRAEYAPGQTDVGHSPITALTLWNPLTGLRRALALDQISAPLSAAVSYDGASVLVTANIDDGDGSPRVGAFRISVDGAAPEFLGPATGSIVPGTLTSDIDSFYGVWRAEGAAERMIRIDPEALPGPAGYRPVVGGVGW